MNELIMMCGLPRSGKSTWIKNNIIDKGLLVKNFYFNNNILQTVFEDENFENVKIETIKFFNIVENTICSILKKYGIEICDSIEYNKKEGFIILSADDIRKHFYKDEYIDIFERMVWGVRDYIFIYLLKKGFNIIIDETNLTVERRNRNLLLTTKYGVNEYFKKCYVVNTCINSIVERTENEEIKNLILKKNNRFVEPSYGELFNEIKIIK